MREKANGNANAMRGVTSMTTVMNINMVMKRDGDG